MKDFWKIFKYSIKLPQKQAVFALNRIGMDKIILYLFFLLAIASIPDLINQIDANVETSAYYMQTFFKLIFFFIFYYLVFVSFILGGLSVIAYIGTWIARGTKRKLRYSILWKMAGCITTIPLLLFTFLSFFYPLSFIFLSCILAFQLIIFIQTILLYPKRRNHNK